MRIGIVASRFNEEISGELLKRARDEAKKLGVEVTVIEVPGALEIPLALQWLTQGARRYDALVAVGAVVRGDTHHFDVVASESARGVSEVALESGIPVANAILTLNKESEARDRFDKGAEGVRVAVEMAKLKASLNEVR
jgi:6,7-dimethyl-8-ribityllumazine synthase